MNAKPDRKPSAKAPARNRGGRPPSLDTALTRFAQARRRASRAQQQALVQLNRRVAPLGLRVVAKSA